MASKKKKNAKRMAPVNVVAIVLCAAMLVYFAYSFISIRADIKSQQAQLDALQAQYEQRLAENEALQKAIDAGDEEALAEQYAREKGYIKQDERVYIDITPGSGE